jgi:hypothetical protein
VGIFFKTIGIGISGKIEPHHGPALAKPRRG